MKAREEGGRKKDARGRPWLHFQSWGGTPGTPRNRVPSSNERRLTVCTRSGLGHRPPKAWLGLKMAHGREWSSEASEEAGRKKDARGRPWLHFQSRGGTPGTPRNRVPSINERQLAVSRKSGKVHFADGDLDFCDCMGARHGCRQGAQIGTRGQYPKHTQR